LRTVGGWTSRRHEAIYGWRYCQTRKAAMDVVDWLRAIGLEHYEAAFRANDVTIALLPALTADDLKDLGVTSVGHRRRILEAIAALRPQGHAGRASRPWFSQPIDRSGSAAWRAGGNR
jgi:SAM domain (Sterile alpha motif)